MPPADIINLCRDEADRLEAALGANLVSEHLRTKAQVFENVQLGPLAMELARTTLPEVTVPRPR